MNLNVDLVGLHKAASKMIDMPVPSLEEARKAGHDAASNGASPENCHFMYFSTTALKDAWEAGNASL
jgi:hypothetical protein